MSQNDYTREELESMDIFALRNTARSVGVSSPTKKNKLELVSQIMAIVSGEVEPPQPPKKGRPPKIEENAVDEKSGQYQLNNRFSEDNQLKDQSGEDEEREGVLEIYADGYGFLRVKNFEFSEKDAYVHSAKIKRFGLRDGD